MRKRFLLRILILIFSVNLIATNASATTLETSVETIEATSNIVSVMESATEPVQTVEARPDEGASIAAITLIMTSITAIAAIVGPVVNSVVNAVNQRKITELEIKLPAAYERLDKLAAAYGELYRFGSDSKNYPKDMYKGSATKFKDFRIAFCQLLPLIPDTEIHMRARDLISQMASEYGGSDEETDAIFFGIIEDIALYISGAKQSLLCKRQEKVKDQDSAAK